MATSHIFAGKLRKLPGVYTEIKSGIENTPRTASYGRILLIDTGLGATFGGGAGINGELESGADAIYRIDNIRDYQSFVKGGLLWLLGQPLFYPNGFQSIGITSVDVVRAATTTAAEMTLSLGDDVSDDDSSVDGGEVVVQVRNEGLIGNGTLSGTVLYKGYALKMFAGENDTNKFIIKFYVGTYKGVDGDDDSYDGVAAADTISILLCSSPEIRTIAELVVWMETDATFNYYFKFKSSTILGSGIIDAADLVNYSSFSVASGGTESYSTDDLDEVLDYITNLDYTFVLADKYGDNAMSSQNGSILAHLASEAKYNKFMVIGGGYDSLKFTQTNGSIPIAQYYDTDQAIVVHGGVKIASNISGVGYKAYPSIYKAAAVLGRICGLQPQIPGTQKAISILGEVHPLKEKEKELCLDNGVLCTGDDDGQFVIVQAINTLQDNVYLINEGTATSFSVQVKRIFAQLNKELYINAKQKFTRDENGTNRFTASPQNLKDFGKSYLKSRTVTTTDDNLILSFRNVRAYSEEDNMFLSYEAVPNNEVNKIFISGIIKYS